MVKKESKGLEGEENGNSENKEVSATLICNFTTFPLMTIICHLKCLCLDSFMGQENQELNLILKWTIVFSLLWFFHSNGLMQ